MPPKTPNAKPKAVTSAELHKLRAESVRTLTEMEEAIVRTRNQLRFMETLMRRVRRMLESGGSATEVARLASAAQARANMSEIIREVQGARHQAQRAQFRLAVAEGATLAEIARTWGVSRQLVSRMVKEPNPRGRG